MLENIEDHSEKLRDNIANHQLCEQALKVLTQLVQSSCASLKLEAYMVMLLDLTILIKTKFLGNAIASFFSITSIKE